MRGGNGSREGDYDAWIRFHEVSDTISLDRRNLNAVDR